MRIPLTAVLDFIKPDERHKEIARRVLQPLFDCSREELDALLEQLRLASARTFTGPVLIGLPAGRLLDDVARMAVSVRMTKP